MGNYFAKLAIGLRNIQAKLIAVAMVVIFSWAVFDNYSQPNLKYTDRVVGEIISSKTLGGEKNNQILKIKIKVKADIFSAIITQKPFPKIGDTVPVLIEVYSDNSKLLIIDDQELQEERFGY